MARMRDRNATGEGEGDWCFGETRDAGIALSQPAPIAGLLDDDFGNLKSMKVGHAGLLGLLYKGGKVHIA